ncbi:protein CREBRF homolog [Dreissena polymorpha]|uniref:protein CREBRF homolog n=1 Tax=Dreissena polymorpha TaxID=45954 RepID=UPI0022648B2D|nr:protein CREBRF homolog [Dreissena polymorpha]
MVMQTGIAKEEWVDGRQRSTLSVPWFDGVHREVIGNGLESVKGNSLTTSARISSDTSVTAVLNVATTSSERVATLTQETDWSKSFIHTQAGRPDIHPSSSPLRIEQPIEVASPHGYLPLQRQCGIAPAQHLHRSVCMCGIAPAQGPEGLDTVVPTATLRPITSVPQISSSQLAQLLLLRQLPGLGKQLITRQQETSSRSTSGSQPIPQQLMVIPQQLRQDNIRRQLLLLQTYSRLRQQTALSIHGPGTATHSPSPLTGQELSAPSPGPTGELTHPGHRVVHTQDSLPGYREAVNMERVRHMSDVHPLINTCADLSLSSDLMDASIYASSPNSLYMYDQEKMDMQCTMGINSTCCTTLDTSSLSDDFDLNSQYEMSHDISSFQVDPVTVSNSQVPRYNVSSTSLASAGSWSVIGKTDDLTHEDVYVSTTDERKTPTLAELNFELLDDIDSYINNQGGSVLKVEAEETNQLKSPGLTSPGLSLLLSQPPLNQPQFSQKSVVIKTEPVDSGSSVERTVTFPRSFSSMKPVKMEMIQPSAKPLGTIKELDISDNTMLQQLLNKPLQSRTQRRRTVSETQASEKKGGLNVRKRTFGTMGPEGMDEKWEEIKQFLEMESRMATESFNFTPTPPVKRERTRYDSTSSVMTLTSNDDDDSDTDKDYDDDSDSDFEGGHDLDPSNPGESLIGAKDKQYFWQYNVQSKGPKGTRVHFDMEEDPHVLNDFEDPVFDPSNSSSLTGIGVSVKHGGKARKGDGNDIVPSPKKLCQIGLQLRKINRQINDFVPVSELPSSARSKTRKEKNKLASRACRLKKKAQHEANKVKLHGLEMEHRKLLTVIRAMKQKMIDRLSWNRNEAQANKLSMTSLLDSLIQQHLDVMIAGNTTEYVNKIIHKVEAGDQTGGLHIQATRSYPKELHN